MSGLADVIPIASRRARSRHRRPEAAAPASPRATLPTVVLRKRVAIFCLGLAASMGLLMLIDHAVASHDVQAQVAQPSPLRRGLYERALADVTAACGLPEARVGLLREHCLDQAKFLTHLPECTGDCVRLTAAVLTPVR